MSKLYDNSYLIWRYHESCLVYDQEKTLLVLNKPLFCFSSPFDFILSVSMLTFLLNTKHNQVTDKLNF